MSSPPHRPLAQAQEPFCCVLREGDQFVRNNADTQALEDLLLGTTTLEKPEHTITNHKKRPGEDLEMLDADTKRHVGPKQAAVSPGLDGDKVDTTGTANDSRILVTPDEEEDNNLANQLMMRDSMNNMPPPQCAAPHSDAANELPLPSPSASPKSASVLDDYNSVRELLPRETETAVRYLERYATTALTRTGINNLVFKLLKKSDRSSLSDMLNSMSGALKRDIVASLPMEVSDQVLRHIDYTSMRNAMLVSKGWRKLVTSDTWKYMLVRDEYSTPEEVDEMKSNAQEDPNVFQKLYEKRRVLFNNWTDPNFEPRKITVPGHGANVVTCLQFDDEKIITGADDKMINIYNPENGDLVRVLQGHDGGVWALKYIGNQIVSGSTDRTVRVWNIKTGKCTHVFRGHTSTIRCMEIVTNDEGERFVITGSRDNTLHVWRLPDESDQGEGFDEEASNNPYFVTVLRGHTASVRAVTGYGNIVVSGSYDHTVRVWDLKNKKTLFVLTGHTDRIYSTILDAKRNRCISASMDSTIKVWDLATGECLADLTKHTSLVGLLGLSASYLVSAAADGTLRGWDPEDYSNKFVLHQDNHAAITTFHATPNFLVSGSEGQFNVYDLRNNGKLVRSNLLPDAGPIWSAKFNDSKCVVAVEKNTHSFIEILDFSKRA